MAACSSCGRPVRWAKTVAGKAIPLDPTPVAHGTLVLRADGAANYADAAYLERWPHVKRFVAHWATCPSRDQHRKPADPGSRATAKTKGPTKKELRARVERERYEAALGAREG